MQFSGSNAFSTVACHQMHRKPANLCKKAPVNQLQQSFDSIIRIFANFPIKKTMSAKHLSDTRFDSLPLSEDLLKGIQEAGFEYCTPIQAQTLPVALQGKDVCGQAQTGTGKTAAFLIATLQNLTNPTEQTVEPEKESASDEESDTVQTESDTENTDDTAAEEKAEAAEDNNTAKQPAQSDDKHHPRAIMIAPTRELAKQIFDDAQPLNKHLNYKLALAYGGTDYDKQKRTLEKGADIIIGTPGRIIDYFKQRVFRLDKIEVLVLDEADRMFDMGFIKDIRFMLRRMPKPDKRLSLLFSATMAERVKELAYEHMNSPTSVKVESDNITADKIEEIGYMPANEEKIPLLLGLLRAHASQKSLVFVNTKYQGETIQRWLAANEFSSGLLSGDVPQRKRESLLKKFKAGDVSILVATDVAARGLHIDGVETVINFDLPQDAEDYVHRIGRTARAGASGKAISLVCETFGINLIDIEQYIDHKLPINNDHMELLADNLTKPKKEEPKARKTGKKKTTKKKTSKKAADQNDKPSAKRADSKTRRQEPVSNNSSFEYEEEMSPENRPQRLIRRRNSKREIPAIG